VALPHGRPARTFCRCAHERFEDAEVLFADERNTGAVYLAGYAVECILKTLLLNSVPANEQEELADSFRGNRAHDSDWLRDEYLDHGGAYLPEDILEALRLLGEWSTDLRYEPATVDHEEAVNFFDATRQVLQWAEGRL
jgi:hypothetical protein